MMTITLDNDDLARVFPPNHRDHVHTYYAHKRAKSAAACRAAVAADFALIIANMRAERMARS
jgi:hypothetical protein